jgi:hypothetical protein
VGPLPAPRIQLRRPRRDRSRTGRRRRARHASLPGETGPPGGHPDRDSRRGERRDFPADRLLVIEVITPSGNWSSYPPHKHDVSNLPAEADLEEIYYYRMEPKDGFALQRLYTEDGAFDAAWTIHDGDLLLVQEGYHAFAVAHGYHAYYLNVLAGDESERTLQPSDDPRYGWVRGTWGDHLNQGIGSYHDIAARQNGPAGKRG